ncbi:xylulokinase [Nitrincola sp. MINF-07-Sa-05]|uniref:xylulokinase n=1 Tax=Nitrincola salilacus TaxID=3400273 RepID=UPI0039185A47
MSAMYLGVDCGTQGTKVVILERRSARILGEGYAAHAMNSNANGRREQSPEWWVEAFVSAYRMAVDKAAIDTRQICGIGVSGQQHGLVVLDKHGEVIRPAKLWCDTETAAENERLLEQLGGDKGSIEQLGLVLATGYTLSKLAWLKRHEPESFARIAHILLPHDYINYWLTGELASEYGDASGTGYFDIRTRCWQTDVLALVSSSPHMQQALPALLPAEMPVGYVSAERARLLGLSDRVIVSSGGGDNMMGAIGTGNVSEGVVTMSLGTSGTLYASSATPPATVRPALAAFCSSANNWLPLICTMNLTGVTNQVRTLLDLDLQRFNSLAALASPGSDGITMLPFLNGERVPALPTASGSILGLNMHNMTQENLCRAVMEGTSYSLRYGLDCLREEGIRPTTLRVTGGGAKSPVWRQLLADLMNTPVISPVESEAAALGGAIQAIWCDHHQAGGAISLSSLCDQMIRFDPSAQAYPNPEAVGEYEAAFQHYLALLQQHYPSLML